MKKIFKYSFISVLVVVVPMFFYAYKDSGDKYFQIAKNLDIFATLFKEVNTYYVDEVNPSDLMREGIDAMLESLDPYTQYIPENKIEDYRTMTTGQYGGIGSIIGNRDGKIMILMPYEGFPAQKAGLKIGDEIIAVDGKDVTGKDTEEISTLLKGQSGTEVKITIRRYGKEEPLDVSLTREKISISNVPYYGMVTDSVGFIKLEDFTSDASSEVEKALKALKDKGAKKLILDLRGNPGGLLSEAVNISNIFVPKGREIVSTKGKVSEWNKTYKALNNPVDTDIPLIVLTSNSSASASEIVSGVMQDYDRGVLVGRQTYGKGLVQATRPLSYNSKLKITTAEYYIPSGRCIQSVDYSEEEKEDGEQIDDSLRIKFETKNGRTVFDRDGIKPDVTVEDQEYKKITQTLIEEGLIFDYATRFYYEHDSIAPAKSFEISDKQYNDFKTWLKDKKYDYTTKVEKNIDELIKNAKKEKYYDSIKNRIDSLHRKVKHNKEEDLANFKAEIIEVLEKEITSRFYLKKGAIEASFDEDEDINEALELFHKMPEYKRILAGPVAKK